MTHTDLTDITLVLDRSGSMESVKESTITAFNEFVSSQIEVEGQATMSLVQFDNEYDVLYEAIPIEQVSELTAETFVPRGSTALLDAMGQTIVRTGQRLAAMPEAERPGTVLFVTLTDGEENSSSEYNLHRINEMITEQREKYSWQFLFLAANQDAIATASQFGIGAGQAMTFGASEQGLAGTMSVMKQKVTSMRESRAAGRDMAPISFDETDRKKAMGKPTEKPERKSRRK
ncbi:vWA domain-containing protein [Rubinisphaera sp.]|uniref:vWA domain-containing protein n=1 Tax=Rubinisphaera sp. TaxID=2024857 RepID=UPI000C0CEF50|nr:vWA domain-containing protein [Rubinisphaera sp.]MBV12223.1 hypothetical protein [Rubinisphaera sp.]